MKSIRVECKRGRLKAIEREDKKVCGTRRQNETVRDRGMEMQACLKLQ